MDNALLIIFIKNPVKGMVKTRLAATIGEEKALQIYHLLLQHTYKTIKDLPFDKAIFYDGTINDKDIWQGNGIIKFLQQGNDLGEKMKNAFLKGFSLRYNKISIIGSDCYELKEHHIFNSYSSLDQNDVVIGPTYDGGYYLLGMKKMENKFFYNKKWSSPSVFEDTLEDIQSIKLQYALLEKLNDIDEEKDLPRSLRLLVNL